MNPFQSAMFGGQSPFVKLGDSVLGVNIPSVLKGINSPEQLVQLLQAAQELQSIQAEVGNADLGTLLRRAAQANALVHDNQELRQENATLKNLIEEGLPLDEVFIAPSFPKDFTYYGVQGALTDEEIQELVIEAAAVNIGEGEFQYVATGNTAVIRLNDGGRIVTVVAEDFFETQEVVGDDQDWSDVYPSADRECDDDCPCRD